ncbi:winged helix-turn-helix domain-containing protein [Deinococcus arcticus]|uniref:winged helix-turn-helix domain-containing protein n=1 Tax=Deinococcus arcticus TaxID=2136176 RepID=UPI002FCE6004
MLVQQLGRARSWLSRVVRLYNEHGPDVIEDHRKGRAGQPPVLDAAGRAALDARLQAAPDDGGEWTARKVAEWIELHTGRRVDPTTALLYLHRLGYSRQKGRPVHPKAASEEAQQEQQKKSGRWLKQGSERTQSSGSSSGARTKRGTARKASSAKLG